MAVVPVTVPDEAFAALRRSPTEFADALRLPAAIHWYSRGSVSQERAAQIAGLDRTDFLMALAREGVDAFTVDMKSLERELGDG
jgi:predicted HTH domain antitoxin